MPYSASLQFHPLLIQRLLPVMPHLMDLELKYSGREGEERKEGNEKEKRRQKCCYCFKGKIFKTHI
jgi:hypothetical protein